MKHKFFFDYIYYRVTKAYFKWDGRTGITAIIGVSMIQVLIIGDVIIPISRLFYDRTITAPYAKGIGFVGGILILVIIFFNYGKYDGTYNKLKSYWKDETESQRTLKGFLVLLSLILPWVPLILIGVYW